MVIRLIVQLALHLCGMWLSLPYKSVSNFQILRAYMVVRINVDSPFRRGLKVCSSRLWIHIGSSFEELVEEGVSSCMLHAQ